MFSFFTKDCLNLDYFVYIMCLNVRKAYSDLSGKPKIVQFDKYKQKHLDTAFNDILISLDVTVLLSTQKHSLNIVKKR